LAAAGAPPDSAGAPPDSAGAPAVRDRGRVQVRDGDLLTDKGTRLRGVTVGRDGGSSGGPLDASLIAELSAQSGLNALHVYLENSGDETGVRADEADELVESTSAAGVYLVIG